MTGPFAFRYSLTRRGLARSPRDVQRRRTMSDRLAELRRQRALVQEHLAWIEREIGVESQKRAPPPGVALPVPPSADRVHALFEPAGATAPFPAPITPAPSAATSASNPAAAEADAILAEYRVGSESLHTHLRKGCFLYLAGAFALLVVGVVALYFLLSHR
jgi:hypothetical protein